jgi:hypothetical protein
MKDFGIVKVKPEGWDFLLNVCVLVASTGAGQESLSMFEMEPYESITWALCGEVEQGHAPDVLRFGLQALLWTVILFLLPMSASETH